MDLRTLLSKEGIDCSTFGPFLGKRQTECWQLATTGTQCVEMWRRLRAMVEQSRYWPVILGDEDSLRLMDECNDSVKDWAAMRAEILKAAAELDGAQWFRDKRDPRKQAESHRQQARKMEQIPGAESMAQLYHSFADEIEKRLRDQGPPVEESVAWPEKEITPTTTFAAPFVSYEPDKHLDKVWLGLAPTTSFWEVPAYVGFGGFNACPGPQVHVALLRHWQRSHGIELVSLTQDTIEVSVDRLPKDREEAIALARDQLTYAEFDNWQTGQLASRLLHSTVWQFWWD